MTGRLLALRVSFAAREPVTFSVTGQAKSQRAVHTWGLSGVYYKLPSIRFPYHSFSPGCPATPVPRPMHVVRPSCPATPVPAPPVLLLPASRPVSPAPTAGPATPTRARVQWLPEEQGGRAQCSRALTWPWFIPPNGPENTIAWLELPQGGGQETHPTYSR